MVRDSPGFGEGDGPDGDGDLDVTELPDMEMPAYVADHEAQEQVAGRLGEPEAVHDPLAVVGVDAPPGVGLQHRGARLLHLQLPFSKSTDPGRQVPG